MLNTRFSMSLTACVLHKTILTSAHAACRRPVPFLRMKLMLRVDDLCRFYACCITASWHPRFGPEFALPMCPKAARAGVMIGKVIGFPFMPSWLCDVRRMAAEDWLTEIS